MAYGTLKADSIVYDNSGSDVALTVSSIPSGASPTFTGNVTINGQGDLRLADTDSSNYVGFQAPGTVSSNVLWTLPGADGSAGQQLTTDGSGTLSWSAAVNVQAASLTGTTMASGVVTSSLTTVGTLTGLTIDGDVTFTGASSNGTWDKSANAFVGNLTGNASTATALATARNIGGVSFDGSAAIDLPGVNTAGNQNTSGTAALATEVTVTANNSTDETVYPLFVDGATGSQGAETDTGLTYNPSTGLLTSTGFSGSGASLTALDASNLSSGTVPTARLGTGSSVTTKFLRGDNTWQTINATPEGTAILSTGESGGTKFLREDGDGTCSWQSVPAAAAGTLSGTTLASGVTGSSLTSLGTLASLTVSGAISMTGTGAIDVASGTTAQRPGSPSAGMFRFNSTSSEFEGYDGSDWGEIGGGGVILIDGGNFDNGSSTVSTANVFDGGDFGS